MNRNPSKVPPKTEELDDSDFSELMRRAQDGDEDAYRQLLAEIYPIVISYCSRFLGRYCNHEDCAQECLVAIHKARHTYSPGRPFRPWLYCIVKHKTIDFLRKGMKSSRREVVDSEIIAEIGSGSSDAHSDLGMLKVLLAGIREDYRMAIVHTKIIGRSIEETAAELGTSKSAVKIWVHRGMKQLQKLARDMEVEAE